MAKLELSEETKAGMEEVGAADLLIAVAVPVDADQLRAAAAQGVLGMPVDGRAGVDSFSALRTVVAFPGMTKVEPAVKAEIAIEQPATGNELRFLPYTLPSGSPSQIPWLAVASTYQALFGMARDLGVSACAVVGFDLAALQSNFLGPMLAPVLRKALRPRNAALCDGEIRRPAELEHSVSTNPGALWQACTLSSGAGFLHFSRNDFRSWNWRCNATSRKDKTFFGRQRRLLFAIAECARCMWTRGTFRPPIAST